MFKSESIKELAAALSKAQGEIKPAAKDAENPFFKSKYADLAAVWEVCREPLSKNGLAISQHPGVSIISGTVEIETIVMHTSGEWMSSSLMMTPKDQSPQGVGSAITYARRYALSSILGIASEEDDDGNAASGKQTVPAKATAPKKTDTDHTKETIKKLCDSLDPLLKTKEDYENFVKAKTGFDLSKIEFYPQIIKSLERMGAK